jgi:hypothetical protein
MKRSTPLKPGKPLARKTPMKAAAFLRVDRKEAQAVAKLRKCAVKDCRKPFAPRSITHKACGPECAADIAAAERKRLDAKQTRERKQALKSRADWERETQAAVNAYVRLIRDADKTCISCGRWHDGQWHAGHYLSRGARPGLRYVEANIAKQCMPCNVHLSGNQVNFRPGLIARIGVAAVEALEADDAPRKYGIEELKAIRDEYRGKLKALKVSPP